MSDVVTPMQVDRRLIELGRELDESHTHMVEAEQTFMSAKTGYEIAIAEARMRTRQRYIERGVKVTVGEIEDEALIATKIELTALNTSEALVKAARANNNRIRTQIDIARSIGASVRASMDMS